jgi:hypothetical protein
MATFSTTEQCAYFAGMKTYSTTTRPTTAMIDSFRDVGYAMVYSVINTGTDTSQHTARVAEMQLVKIMIDNVRYGTNIPVQFTPDMYAMLCNAFSAWGFGTFNPNQNG